MLIYDKLEYISYLLLYIEHNINYNLYLKKRKYLV